MSLKLKVFIQKKTLNFTLKKNFKQLHYETYVLPNHTMEFYYSPQFEREIKTLAKKYRSIAEDFTMLLADLEDNPLQGNPLGQDCFKIRMAIKSKNKGKSGGARVITCVKIVKNAFYFLSIYDKSEKEDIEDKELDAVLKSLGLKP